MQALEKVNPNKAALASPLLNGKWELVYTTSSSVVGSSKPAFLRPSGPIYQYIGMIKATYRHPLAQHPSACFVALFLHTNLCTYSQV